MHELLQWVIFYHALSKYLITPIISQIQFLCHHHFTTPWSVTTSHVNVVGHQLQVKVMGESGICGHG